MTRIERSLWLAAWVSLLCMGPKSFGGEPIFVDSDAVGANNGSSWTDAYNHLQDALADAASRAKPLEIRVAQGIYKPDQGGGNTPGDREATFRLINGVTVKGGYAGFGSPFPDLRILLSYQCTLSGDLEGNDVAATDPCEMPAEPTRAENSYNVVTVSGTDANAVLDGFTITAGHANAPLPLETEPNEHTFGAGMYNSGGSPTVVNCTFTANSAFAPYQGSSSHYGGAGGGMYNDSEIRPILAECTFTGNWAAHGGGMYNDNCYPTLTDCTFAANSADYAGGAICNEQSSPSLTHCTFNANSSRNGAGLCNMWSDSMLAGCEFGDNVADGYGGAIYNEDSRPTLIDCGFTGNSAESGGGIYIYAASQQSSPTMIDCTFAQNTAGSGGAIYNATGVGEAIASPILINCKFIDNSATGSGGAIYNRNNSSNTTTSPIVTRSLFAGNYASYKGGGIYIYGAKGFTKPTLENCTFNHNSAVSGGTMYNRHRESSGGTTIITIRNSIFRNGAPNEISNDGNPIVVVTYSNVEGGCDGLGNIDADPCFADPENGDYHLKSQAGRWDPNTETWVADSQMSPCIDAGDPNSYWADELWPHGQRANMGAYGGAIQASLSLSEAGNIADLNGDKWVDYNDMMILAEKWLCDEALLREDLKRDGCVSFTDFAVLIDNWQISPPMPPTPNPMTWAMEPYNASPYSIAMSATKAVSADGSGVEYYFEDFHHPGCNSGWLSFGPSEEPSWEDSGLDPNTQYWYRVKARNTGNLVETEWSELAWAMTFPEDKPPTPDPMTWMTKPYATSSTTIAMVATIAASTDGSTVEYYFEDYNWPAYNSGWILFGPGEEPIWEDSGLSPNTEYQYRVKARNEDNGLETAWSEPASAKTLP